MASSCIDGWTEIALENHQIEPVFKLVSHLDSGTIVLLEQVCFLGWLVNSANNACQAMLEHEELYDGGCKFNISA